MKLKYNDTVHGYWYGGKRCKGVSTVAKIPEDTWNLDQWRKRMVLTGAAHESALAVAARWYVDDKDVLNEIAEMAMRSAGAHLAAERGTAVHATTEAHDLGGAVDDAASAERWAAILDATGFDVVPELIERCVVFPEQGICGRFDRYARRRADGRLACLDLKTGASAVRYPHSTVIQLAMYANAPLLAGEMVATSWDDDGMILTEETDSFTELPSDLDREVGYVIFMPDDGEAAVHPVNLKLGWQAVQDVVFPTLAWRRTRPEKLIRRL